MNIKKMLAILSVIVLYNTHDLYEPLKSNVQKLGKQNWQQILQKGIQKNSIFLVHFYYSNDGKSYEFSKTYEENADKFYGIINFAHVNCSDDNAFCKKNGPKNYPALVVYPPVPIPSTEFELDMKKAVNKAARYVQNNTQAVTDENFQGFLGTEATLPKVLFFTDKPRVSLVLKSLSTNLKEKMKFGVVQKDQTEVVDHFRIKNFPALLVQRNNEKKPHVFNDKFDYKKMFEFLNIYSQQFVPKQGGTEEDKPWLFQSIPEMHSKSAKEICLNHQKTLCMILLSPGEITNENLEQMKELKRSLDNRTSRLSFKFMWLNTQKHPEWLEKMEVSKDKAEMRVLKTGRRTKYYKLEKDFSAATANQLIEKIFGGDARSNSLRSGVPNFTSEL